MQAETNMISVYVVWALAGPTMITLLQYDNTADQEMAMGQWSAEDYVAQAFDAEFPTELNTIGTNSAAYELAGIFKVDKPLEWIY